MTAACHDHVVLLDAYAKLRKSTIDFVVSVLSVRMEQLGSHWTDFYETWYMSSFWKSVLKIQSFIKIRQE
jgi:hypothetical protein